MLKKFTELYEQIMDETRQDYKSANSGKAIKTKEDALAYFIADYKKRGQKLEPDEKLHVTNDGGKWSCTIVKKD